MIINIHGFNGNAHNQKFQWLSQTYADDILSPQMDYARESPFSVLERLQQEISQFQRRQGQDASNKMISVVGTSLGGFFGYALHNMYPHMPTVLFNPSLTPFITLSKSIAKNILIQYIDIYKSFYGATQHENLRIFFGRHDDLIDYKKFTLPVLGENFTGYVETDQDHHIQIDEQIARVIRENNYISASKYLHKYHEATEA